MTLSMDELFEIVTKTIAEPHTTITDQHKNRAIRVFLYFDEYLMENVPGGGTELGEIDFGSYAAGVLYELEGK